MGALAHSVVRQWQQYDGSACIFLEEEQLVLIEERLSEITADAQARQKMENWCAHLSAWLAACGGVLGDQERHR